MATHDESEGERRNKEREAHRKREIDENAQETKPRNRKTNRRQSCDLLSACPAALRMSYSVFGYGSLIWKPPPFPFTQKTGYIKNHLRRFAQRSHDHRGTPASHGLVATLVTEEDWEAFRGELRPWIDFASLLSNHLNSEDEPLESTPRICWGTVFTFETSSHDPESEIWRYLDHREKDGFTRKAVDVYASVDGIDQIVEAGVRSIIIVLWATKLIVHQFQCNVYVGEITNPSFETNPHFMRKIARRIASSTGPSGTNREYLYNLAEAIRSISTVEDSYLVILERFVKAEVVQMEKQRKMDEVE